MQVTEKLTPAGVWKWFEEISCVPRPSKKEEKILAYLIDFAKKNNLEYKQDAIGNVVIIREATASKKNAPTVVLQSHVDMVCEKNSDVVIDFDNDPIKLKIDGEWLKADGTTLGADCGIGMAIAMAVLTEKDIETPRIEALFTVDEETGLTGAFELGENMLSGKYMINLDSEDEGEVYIGCAGGIDTLAHFPFVYEPAGEGKAAVKLRIYGLKGGHSGDDINRRLGNSNLMLCRFLFENWGAFDFRVQSIDGGNLRNAIPREIEAVVLVDAAKVMGLKIAFESYAHVVKAEYYATEPGLEMSATDAKVDGKVIASEVSHNIVKAVITVPNGVYAMSQDIDGFVETSTNLASIKVKEGFVEVVTSQRSSLESKKMALSRVMNEVFSRYGADVRQTDGYPGWAPVPNSTLLDVFVKEYRELFGKEIAVKVIHAGLECGLILKKYPQLEMVSVGPTLKGVHSPDERLEIKTVDMFWLLLKAVLKNI